MKAFIRLSLLAAVLLAPCGASAEVIGNMRGVTFYYVNGVGEGIRYVLDHQDEAPVKSRLDLMFAKYKASGVNWVRLIVFPDHFPNSPYPTLPGDPRIGQLNQFMMNDRAQGITFEVMVGQKFCNGLVNCPSAGLPTPDYYADQTNLQSWINGLNYARLGLVSIGGELFPCDWYGARKCEGEVGASERAINHGQWIRTMWSWVKTNYPTLNVTYEVGAVDPLHIGASAHWVSTNTPGIPTVTTGIYQDPPAQMSEAGYKAFVLSMLNGYLAGFPSGPAKPLILDEYGFGVGQVPSGLIFDETYQRDFYAAFYKAVTCEKPAGLQLVGLFAWVTGNDYPSTAYFYMGLFSGFIPAGGTEAVVERLAWDKLRTYYKMTSCS